jgi:hypothetical protein
MRLSIAPGLPTFPWAANSSPVLLSLALASATLARAQSPLEVSGALVSTDEDVEVRVDLKNTSDERLAGVRLGGDLLGRHADRRCGDLEPGHTASALLSFPFASEWRPGRHVLPLSIDYRAGPGPPRRR